MKAAKLLAKWTFDRFGVDAINKSIPYRIGGERYNAYMSEMSRLIATL